MHILTRKDYSSDNIHDYLSEHFHPEYGQPGTMWIGKRQLTEDESQERWALDFHKNLPWKKLDRLIYIANSTSQYWHGNYIGSVNQKYIWPEFFKVFPKGKILIAEFSNEWFTAIWHGQFDHAREIEFERNNPPGLTPQEMSGLLADNFPSNSLLIAAHGIYPLILFSYAQTHANLMFIYVPQVSFRHSQMTEIGGHVHVLWCLHHILDDQWTFDGSRGPKSAAPKKHLKPTDNIDYIRWTVNLIGDRMHDLLAISNPVQREQLAMTFSRAVCDAILSVSTQLPYISKEFLFACLDKLANIQFQIGEFKSEVDAWKSLIDISFLEDDLIQFISSIPGSAGEELKAIVQWVSQELAADNMTPEILRDIRNTHHGYGLHADSVERLFKHSGELNNDITLLATPLVLFVLSKNWSNVKS